MAVPANGGLPFTVGPCIAQMFGYFINACISDDNRNAAPESLRKSLPRRPICLLRWRNISVDYNPNPNAAISAPEILMRSLTGETEFHRMWQRPKQPEAGPFRQPTG